MRRIVLATMMILGLVTIAAAEDKDKDKPAGAAKGAAVGALAGHEIGSGHTVAGAATGAAVGHHQRKKAEEKQSKQ